MPVDAKRHTERVIVELAHQAIQLGGYHNLGFGAIAEELSISRAAIHHHFPSKEDLARRVLVEYRQWTMDQFKAIDASLEEPEQRLSAYINLYRQILVQDDSRLCPGGMLAAEVMTLPPALQSEAREFFALHVSWVSDLCTSFGIASPQRRARSLRLVAELQGGLLVARLFRDIDSFDSIAQGAASTLRS